MGDYPIIPNSAMDGRLWRGRHYGDSQEYAEEAARRLGGGAMVVCHGKFSWGVYQPKFKPIEHKPEEHGKIRFELAMLDGEAVIIMSLDDGDTGADVSLRRGDIATLMSVTLPEAAALLDSIRTPGRPTRHTRHSGAAHGD